MDRSLLMDMARRVTRLPLGSRVFQIRGYKHYELPTSYENGKALTVNGCLIKVTQSRVGGRQQYLYELRTNGVSDPMGLLNGTQGGVGTVGPILKSCNITATAVNRGWAGVYSGRPGKISVEANEGDVQVDFGSRSDGIGEVTARIETLRGKITVRDEPLRHHGQFPYYPGSLAVAIKRAAGRVDALIGNGEDGKPFAVTVTVDGLPYRAEIDGESVWVVVEERRLQIFINDVVVIEEALAPSN